MTIENLKQNIINYNSEYRKGTPIVSDDVYDNCLNDLESSISEQEYESFIRTLTEEKGNSKFDYVVGSLNKIKYEKSEDLYKWIKKEHIENIFISEKIDGASVVLKYRNYKLVGIYSRGDGNEGTDWSDKAQYISSIPKTLISASNIDIRGELTFINNDYIQFGYKNKRNGVVGSLGEKTLDSNKLSFIQLYAYEVLSENWEIMNQFMFLDGEGFKTPFTSIFKINNNLHESLKSWYFKQKEIAEYDIDGIVMSDITYKPERNNFLPSKKVAFKISIDAVQTTITDITWELSKNRLLKPVCQVKPIEISGSTISNVTAYNAKYILDYQIGIDAIVTLEKSGEIIPRIVDIIKQSNQCNLPTQCPECNNKLKWKGVELYCSNISCGEIKRIESFIKNIGIERVSETTLRNWYITTFDKLIRWTPDNSKSQTDFYNQLNEKVFNNTQVNIMRSFSYDGFGTTLFDSYFLNKCNSDLQKMKDIIYNKDFENNLIEGIGVRTLEKMRDDFLKNYNIMIDILGDIRYKEPIKKERTIMSTTSNKLNGKSFLFTGKLSQVRSNFEQIVSDNGGINGSVVNKNLSYLVCGVDTWDISSKFKKAEKLNIPIITENEFMSMI